MHHLELARGVAAAAAGGLLGTHGAAEDGAEDLLEGGALAGAAGLRGRVRRAREGAAAAAVQAHVAEAVLGAQQAWLAKDSSQCPSVSQWMNVIQNMEVQPSINVEPEPVDANQLQIKTLVMKKMSEMVSSGLPPKMEISHEIIEFGTLHTSDLHSEFYISNTGGSALTGEITSESWLEAVPKQFAVQPGEQQAVRVTLRPTSPRPKSGLEYRTASALAIDSNIGAEVIGARYKLQKPPFYSSAWAKALAGTTLGLIILLSCICLIAAAFLFSRQF